MFANLYHLQIPYIFSVFYYAFPFPTKQTKSPPVLRSWFLCSIEALKSFLHLDGN